MPDTIRKVDYFSVQTANKPGEAARLLKGLRDAGVNLLAFTGFPSGRRAQIDFIPENTGALQAAGKKMRLSLGKKKTVFLVQGDDRVGALHRIFETLGSAKINVTALDAVVTGEGRYGAIFWVKPRDIFKASKLLGAA